MRHRLTICAAVVLFALAALPLRADTFNGGPDREEDQYGFYFAVGGGLFPTGYETRNGSSASGGTLRYITDDPGWSPSISIDTWHKDNWSSAISSLALTLQNGGSVVFDNNGIETNQVPTNYWHNPLASDTIVGYSMSNIFDLMYAGYFHLNQATTVDQITGYFLVSSDPASPSFGTGPFNPNNPIVQFHTNIFSEVAGLLPKNTGSFAGDVFSSDRTGGTFSWSDTGYNRETGDSNSDIYRLTYTLNAPIQLGAGNYYFAHDATITPLPSTVTGGLALLAMVGAGEYLRRRRPRAAVE